jgi:hypothetical protein
MELVRQTTDAIRLVQLEYAERPELELSAFDLRCLLDLEPSVADIVLETLVASEFLQETRPGYYVRSRTRAST